MSKTCINCNKIKPFPEFINYDNIFKTLGKVCNPCLYKQYDAYKKPKKKKQPKKPAKWGSYQQNKKIPGFSASRAAFAAKRNSAKLDRTPQWLTKEHLTEIREHYEIAAYLTQCFGVCYEVDHIVPLQVKHVSGLHVPWNLRVITESENNKKRNKFELILESK